MDYEVYWKQVLVGAARDASSESFWTSAHFEPAPLSGELQAYVEYLDVAGDDVLSQDLPFSDELLESSNWSVVDSAGERQKIEAPAIHLADAIIGWRWQLEQ